MSSTTTERPASNTTGPIPELMTVTQAAAKLGVSEDWLATAARAGDVPSRKVGQKRRFTDQDLLDYLERVRKGTVDPMARNARSQSKVGRRPHRSGSGIRAV